MRKRHWKIFGIVLLLLAGAAWLLRDSMTGAMPRSGGGSILSEHGPDSGDLPDVLFPLKRDILTSWGYKETGSGSRPQRDWEKERFGRAGVLYQEIKSLAELSDMPSTYFRFILVEESYLTPEEAECRARELTFVPEGLDSKMEPELVLRKGFANGPTVYFIETDAVRFGMEIPVLLARLKDRCETTPARDVFGSVPESPSEVPE